MSTATDYVLCSLLGRVPQPLILLSNARYPKGLIAGCVFLWLLSLAQAKESESPKGEKECELKEMHTAQYAIAYCLPTYYVTRLLD